ncbi:MAG: DNA polymerase [Bacteroidetes bacterium]|nr:DNA polymerase [Bacteroidota bacterium]
MSDYLKAINITKENIMESDPMAEKEYVPFVVNRTLSYFPDTVLYANEMNLRGGSDHRLQFEYLINSVRAKKRFSRWLKPEKNEDVDAIKEYYNCSYNKANEIVKVLTGDQLSLIHKRLERGGLTHGKSKRRSNRTA